MATKRDRDRRERPSQSRGESRSNKLAPTGHAADLPSEKRQMKCSAILLAVVIIPCLSLLVYHFKYHHLQTDSQFRENGRFVKTDLDYEEILESSKLVKNETYKHYTYPVLAYVTPWNSRGYDMAKLFAKKFTHISPVWYDLKSLGSGIILEGRHNADPGWISEIRMRGDVLVLPRVVLEVLPKKMLNSKKLTERTIDLIISECREMDYDGIVLESWSRWMAYGVLSDPDMRNKALEFVKQLGQTLHSVTSMRKTKQNLQLFYVIGPPHSEKLQVHDFGPPDLRRLSSAVDGFSLMTYDFSGPQNPGPNAPLKWVQSTLQILLGTDTGVSNLGSKILLGINYYGNDFVLSGDSESWAIIGSDYLSLLEKHRPQLQWEKNSGEHLFFYVDDNGSKHVVFYPTLASIYLRLEEARIRGTGISIWEIGQGLDYFFDLL